MLQQETLKKTFKDVAISSNAWKKLQIDAIQSELSVSEVIAKYLEEKASTQNIKK